MLILNSLLLSLIFGGLVFAPLSVGLPIIYYVAPTETSCVKGQDPCYTLETYVNNKTEFFKQGSNVTMKFLNGTHLVNGSGIEVVVNVSSLKMIGEGQSTLINSTNSHHASWHIQSRAFHMENFVISGLRFNISVVAFNMKSVTFWRSIMHILPLSSNLTVTIADADFLNHSRIKFIGNNSIEAGLSSELTRCRFQNNSYLKVTSIGNLSISQTQFLSISDWSSYYPLLTMYYSCVVLTDVSFEKAHQTAVLAYISDIMFHGEVNFTNNVGFRGGALSLFSTTLYIDNAVRMYFVNNSARDRGGAIYLNEDLILTPDRDYGDMHCFYQVLHSTETDSYVFNFENSSAVHGGIDIYGTSLLSNCLVSSDTSHRLNASQHFNLSSNDGLSSVSADPSRICVCEFEKPKCADDLSNIFFSRNVYPGETITFSVVLTGGDFGATVGSVHAGFLGHTSLLRKSNGQSSQEINQPRCIDVRYTLYANESTNYVMYLSPYIFASEDQLKSYFDSMNYTQQNITTYHKENRILYGLLTTPVFINITTLPCPLGFSEKDSECVCDNRLRDLSPDLRCNISDGHAFMEWSGSLWLGVNNDTNNLKLEYGDFCWYCSESWKTINVLDVTEADFDVQCQSNRGGRLCGKCLTGYSLAIGSSRCILCSNNNNVSLIIFFAAAGFLLIFIIISLNLTVSQGMINGLVFYANIVWAYQGIILPNSSMPFIQTFIAWINLDFGIETCFIKNLNAIGKTWLQFVFPVYTASLFFIGLRFSEKLCTLLGKRSVSTLATLIFLSHSDLLKTIIEAIGLTQIMYLDAGNSTGNRIVWSGDGNIDYGSLWHIPLVLVALACFFLLWLPYALLILYMQWLRKLSNSRLSKWITRYKPFFDTYYAPLKDNHHYWFGVLLIAQGILLILSSLTSHLNQFVSLFMILVFVTVLLFYMNFMQVYQNTSVLVTESLFFVNLILLVGGLMYAPNSEIDKKVIVSISISFVFLQLCGIIIWSVVWTYCLKRKFIRKRKKLYIYWRVEFTKIVKCK